MNADSQGMPADRNTSRGPEKTLAAPPKRRPSGSTVVAGSFVLAAAAIGWFGMTGNASPAAPAGDTPIITAAGDERPQAAVAGISIGGLPTRIVVPSAGVDTSIAEVGLTVQDGKTVWETAWRAAGHHMDSAMPGQPGNMVITGHVSVSDRSNVAVFRDLESVAAGDVVEVYSGDNVYRYQVSKVMVVPPTAVKLLRSGTGSTVTLVTCTKDLRNRLVVIGTLAG